MNTFIKGELKMDIEKQLIIRLANLGDIEDFLAMENTVWAKAKVKPLTDKHFLAWLEVHPDGFWVAEIKGRVRAYVYIQSIHFNPGESVPESFDQATDNGFTYKTHEPNGNCNYIVSACSMARGAGDKLVESLIGFTRSSGKQYLVGMSRIPWLNKYIESNKSDLNLAYLLKERPKELALWYAAQTAAFINKESVKCSFGSCSLFRLLPSLKRPDLILGNFLKFTGSKFIGIVNDFFVDPASLNFAALVAYGDIKNIPCYYFV